MDIGQLVLKIRDLITKARTGDYWGALSTLLEVINSVVGSMPAPGPVVMMASPAKSQAMASSEAKTADELLDDLEACCNQHAPSQGMHAGPPTGPFIDKFLPIALALLKKFLGF